MEKDDSREAATSSLNPCFQPNFKPSAITQHQRAKFRELQQRRLQMKAKIQNKKKSKSSSNFHCKKDKIQVEDVDNVDERCKVSVKHCSKGEDSNDVPLSTSHVDTHPALKKKKLHWG
ncbi:Sodium/hydrogen exchanger 3 [Bienertia sinuspersici]